jgi:hypothetical protein
MKNNIYIYYNNSNFALDVLRDFIKENSDECQNKFTKYNT